MCGKRLTFNANWKDSFDSTIAVKIGLDTSIGVGQVKVSTAQLLEDKGYVPKTIVRWYESLLGIDRKGKIAIGLDNCEKNIQYVAAYLKYQTDIWEPVCPQIRNNPELLGTLYNLGHEIRGDGLLGYILGIGNRYREPHPNPDSNKFGRDVKSYYHLMNGLLEGECSD